MKQIYILLCIILCVSCSVIKPHKIEGIYNSSCVLYGYPALIVNINYDNTFTYKMPFLEPFSGTWIISKDTIILYSEKFTNHFSDESTPIYNYTELIGRDAFLIKRNHLFPITKNGYSKNCFLLKANKNISNEIGVLAASDQVYDVQIGLPKIFQKEGTTLYGATYCNSGIVTAAVNANINKNSSLFLGTLAHELKHAYQFEIGNLSFSAKGGRGIAHDYTDEIEAHARGGLFGAAKTPDKQYYIGLGLNINSIEITPQNANIFWNNYYRLNGVTHKP